MSDLMQDPTTGELILANGDFEIATGIDAIIQDLEATLQFFYGEWFLDTTKGIPYYQSILVKDPNLTIVQSLLQDAILAVNGIVELLTFSFDYDGPSRSASVTFSASSTNGPINFDGKVIL